MYFNMFQHDKRLQSRVTLGRAIDSILGTYGKVYKIFILGTFTCLDDCETWFNIFADLVCGLIKCKFTSSW